MSEKVYPIHFKKIVNGFIDTKYAHNAKEEEKWRAEGFVADQPMPIVKYPCAMYDSNGAIVSCSSDDQKAELIKDGYSEKPVVRKETKTAAPVGASDRAGRIEALEDAVSDLKDGQAEILSLLQALRPANKGRA